MSKQSTTTPQQILNSPLNNSKTKFHYSFSKSPRFKKAQPSSDKQYYETYKFKSMRGAGIGYGKKYDFTQSHTNGPEPAQYHINSLFDHNRSHFKGSSFGLGRNQLKEFSYINHALVSHPGPGQYITEPSRVRAFSMRSKNQNPWMPSITIICDQDFLKNKDSSDHMPGPGHYESSLNSIQSDGKNSKNRSAVLIDPSCKRFHSNSITNTVYEGSVGPGPGGYQTINTLSDDGQYPVSNYRGQGKRIFGAQERRSFIDDAVQFQQHNPSISPSSMIVPGPGNYKQHSEFGLYENHILIAKYSRPVTAEYNNKQVRQRMKTLT